MKTGIKSTFFLFTAAIVWGFAFVAQKFGAESVTPIYFNAVRFLIGALTLLPVVLIFEREPKDREKLRRTIRAGAVCAFFLSTASVLQQYGIGAVGAGKCAFITSLYSAFVPIACFVLFRHKTALNVWIGAALAIFGVFLLSMGDRFTVTAADLILYASVFLWTGHVIAVDRSVSNVSPLKFAFFQALFVSLYQFILAFLTRPVTAILADIFPSTDFSAYVETLTLSGILDALIPLLYCGMCSTAIAYTCQILGQKGADPTFATIVLSTESVFGVLGGVLLGDETLSPKGVLGCVLAFAGVVISQLDLSKFHRKSKTSAQQ